MWITQEPIWITFTGSYNVIWTRVDILVECLRLPSSNPRWLRKGRLRHGGKKIVLKYEAGFIAWILIMIWISHKQEQDWSPSCPEQCSRNVQQKMRNGEGHHTELCIELLQPRQHKLYALNYFLSSLMFFIPSSHPTKTYSVKNETCSWWDNIQTKNTQSNHL